MFREQTMRKITFMQKAILHKLHKIMMEQKCCCTDGIINTRNEIKQLRKYQSGKHFHVYLLFELNTSNMD